MNPEYVVLGGLLWRVLHKRIGLWYVHKSVTLKLRLATLLADVVFTSVPQSINRKSKKIRSMGHGVDTSAFSRLSVPLFHPVTPRLVSVGRITPIKNLEIPIHALALLREKGIAATLDIIGSPAVPTDSAYEESLRVLINDKKLDASVSFVGSISNIDIPAVYAQYDLSINAAPTGGIDKVVLESMAAGVLPLVSNEAFRTYFGEHASNLIYKDQDPGDLANKIQRLLIRTDIPKLQQDLRDSAKQHADVTLLVPAIIKQLHDSDI